MYFFLSIFSPLEINLPPSACQILCYCVKIIGKVFSVGHN